MANIEKRTGKNGVGYRAKVRLKGCPPITATFDSITKAKDWVSKIERKVKDGKYLSEIESRKHTLGEAIDRYITKVLPTKPKMVYNWGLILNYWKGQASGKSLFDITTPFLIEQRDKLAERRIRKTKKDPEGKPMALATINRYMGVLQVVLSVAYKEWEWIDKNPFDRLRKLPEKNQRVRYLSDDERERLLIACQDKAIETPYLYPAVIMAILTGARKMEILTLRWENVDLQNGRAILQETKNGERRTIPIVGKAYELMRGLHSTRKSDEWVFPSRDKTRPFDITRAWKRALKLAGITNFKFHDLRHTCASYLAMEGKSMGEIAAVLGHKTLQMTKRYAHLSDAHIQSVVEGMNHKLFGGGNP